MCKFPFLATSLNIILTVAVLSLSIVQPSFAQAPAPTTLQIVDQKIGNGAVAQSGADVMVQYTGYLWVSGLVDNKGKKFDSSFDRSTPFHFVLGGGRVIRGWDEGLVGMRVGGKRTLIIPAEKAYGARAVGANIPPNSALVFDVELVCVGAKGCEEQFRSKSEHKAREEKQACDSLYVGKPVGYTLSDGCMFDCKKRGVITGVGRGVAGVKSEQDGVTREKLCTDLY